jgi:ubiquinone/menaquinone biosynthesis C-methylase UbiE
MSAKLYKEYWLDIDPERFERYKAMFQWSPRTEPLISPANIRAGHVVVDVGCGPGFVAVELAKRVGADGHVHAIDINRDFVEHAKQLVRESGLANCVTVHLVDGGELPLAPSSIDRVLAMNVMVYVDDPAATYREFRRVLKPGGIAHVVDSDWDLTLAEPVPRDLWSELILAHASAFRTPNIGRRLFGYAKAAGFSAIEVQVVSRPDTVGRLLPMVRGLCNRAKKTRAMDPKRVEEIERVLEEAAKSGTLLILNPQFMVTATA